MSGLEMVTPHLVFYHCNYDWRVDSTGQVWPPSILYSLYDTFVWAVSSPPAQSWKQQYNVNTERGEVWRVIKV